jgi:uncharacterized protein
MKGEQPESMIELAPAESWVLLRRAVVGRLAVIVDERPDIFPVNHKVDHGTVLFHTAEGSKLTAAVGREVAFEVDGYDDDASTAWSVVVKGTAQEIVRLYDVLDVFELPLFPWHQSSKPHFIRIEPDSITGRRFQVTADPRSPLPIRHVPDE